MDNWQREWVDYYEELGVSPRATLAVVRAAYRAMTKDFHPDRSPSDLHRMQRINAAFEVLSDPQRRQRYDTAHRLRNQVPPHEPPRQRPPSPPPPSDPPKQSESPEKPSPGRSASHEPSESEPDLPPHSQAKPSWMLVLLVVAGIIAVLIFWGSRGNDTHQFELGTYNIDQPLQYGPAGPGAFGSGWIPYLSTIYVPDNSHIIIEVLFRRTGSPIYLFCPELDEVHVLLTDGSWVLPESRDCADRRIVNKGSMFVTTWEFHPLDGPSERFAIVTEWDRTNNIGLPQRNEVGSFSTGAALSPSLKWSRIALPDAPIKPATNAERNAVRNGW